MSGHSTGRPARPSRNPGSRAAASTSPASRSLLVPARLVVVTRNPSRLEFPVGEPFRCFPGAQQSNPVQSPLPSQSNRAGEGCHWVARVESRQRSACSRISAARWPTKKSLPWRPQRTIRLALLLPAPDPYPATSRSESALTTSCVVLEKGVWDRCGWLNRGSHSSDEWL